MGNLKFPRFYLGTDVNAVVDYLRLGYSYGITYSS
jgi:hypothetical protein